MPRGYAKLSGSDFKLAFNPLTDLPVADSPSTLDASEVDRFRRLADRWWDPAGPMHPLHDINPLRLDYICERWIEHQIGQKGPPADPSLPLQGVEVLDIGCGGGLVCEALVGRGAKVLGVDGADEMIAVAKDHAGDLDALEYRVATAEALLPASQASFDLVCCLEVIEHVADPSSLMQSCARLLRPGGLAVFSTINRTPLAFLGAIVGAEYLLGLLPKGTHEYRKLVRPAEMARWGRQAGLQVLHLQGMGYNPLTRSAFQMSSTAVNYLATFAPQDG